MQQPDYACAVISDEHGWLLLQLRPATARYAAQQLTCFGGARIAGETAAACLVRELHEELGWSPKQVDLTSPIRLLDGTHWIAAFYPVLLPPGLHLTIEPGFCLLRSPLCALPGLPLSPWHALVIAGWQRGASNLSIGALLESPEQARVEP